MTGYLLHLIFYTAAMIGIILIGFVIAKKSLMGGNFGINRNNFLNIESFLCLEPRKNLYVIKAGTEHFLISTDNEGTKILAKLETRNIPHIDEPEIIQDNPNQYYTKFKSWIALLKNFKR